MPPLLSSPSEKGGLVLRYFPSRIEGVVGFPPLSEKEGWLSFRDGVNGVRRLPPLSHRRDVSSSFSLVEVRGSSSLPPFLQRRGCLAFLLSLREGVTALFQRWSEGVRCLPPLFQRRDGSSSFSLVEVRGPSSPPPCSQRRGAWPSLHSFREGERLSFIEVVMG